MKLYVIGRKSVSCATARLLSADGANDNPEVASPHGLVYEIAAKYK